MAATRSDLSIGTIHFLYRNSSFPVQNGFKYQFCTGLALFRYKSIDSCVRKKHLSLSQNSQNYLMS